MLTMIAFSLLFSILVIKEIFSPTLRFLSWKEDEEFKEELRYYKLRVIRTFYPVLRNMSYDEINEKYGVNKVYDTVGRAYLRHRNGHSSTQLSY